jgi:hypothetical protein
MTVRHSVLAGLALVALGVGLGVTASAQMKRPFHDGSVWSVQFIRVKPGMETAYLNYLASDWKRAQEAAKQAGFIQDYKVLTTEAHGATDWNLLLMTQAKDLASVEANQEKVDAMMQKVVGDDQKQMQGYKDRESMREPLGSRVAREVVLEPKP